VVIDLAEPSQVPTARTTERSLDCRSSANGRTASLGCGSSSPSQRGGANLSGQEIAKTNGATDTPPQMADA
jgi:hypothetical protein